MRIGILSQWYPPEPAFVPGELARELAARGHEVRVLTAFPSYPEGQVYPGYRQRWNELTTTGSITVRRVPVYPSHDNSAARRVASYLSFAATSSLAGLRYLGGVDAIYVYHPPPTAYAAAGLLQLARRIPTILHVQDMWPESVTSSAMTPGGRAGSALHRALTATMRRLYRAASGIAVIAPSMAGLVIERGADPGKVRVVLNWTDESLFRPVPATDAARQAIGHRGRCTVMFAGNLGPFQRVQTAVRAAAAVGSRMDLVIVGSGPQEQAVRRLADELRATNVRFLGRRPVQEMAALYAAAEYQLITLRDLPALRGTVPCKLQAALACGSPVIVSAPGDAARLVSSAGAGLTCAPEDWRALADRFIDAAETPPARRAATGRRARRLYEDRMSLPVGVDQIEDMLSKVGTHEGTLA
ncbi:MAG TPA: glycosyltransferase family 4 protein [Rugosimonospora sp.]|jgi:glycosyltransferase involved in cell wall biosynthesis